MSILQKGLFWVVGSGEELRLLTYAVKCDTNGNTLEDSPVYNSKKGNSFSHERSWSDATESETNKIRSKPWNYFPRGRVEIKNGKATVYYNPTLDEWNALEAAVSQSFGLGLLPTTMNADYSEHYKAKQKCNL